jgi:hypothetical protein
MVAMAPVEGATLIGARFREQAGPSGQRSRKSWRNPPDHARLFGLAPPKARAPRRRQYVREGTLFEAPTLSVFDAWDCAWRVGC